MACSSQHVTKKLYCENGCQTPNSQTCMFCNGTQSKQELMTFLFEKKEQNKKHNFQQEISTVYILANDTVSVLDQKNEVIPFFAGRQDSKMRSIKNRLEKQKPCIVTWIAQKGAKFDPIGVSVGVYT